MNPITNGVRLALSVSRLHIVAIAALGCFTFGWAFTGRYPWLLAAICALDWFLVNLLNRVVDQKEDQANAITGADFAGRHRRGILLLGFSLLGGSLLGLHLVLPALTPLRLAYHLLGMAYNWPLLPGGRRIKELYFWKNTASATGFMITVFGYPLIQAASDGAGLLADVTVATIAVSGIFFFFFELSYEVIYDLRDAPGDQVAGVRTYPVVHGEGGAIAIADGLIAGSMLVLLTGYLMEVVPWRIFIMIFAPTLQLALSKIFLRRGITSAHCTGLTWLGAALLFVYHVWVMLDLPGARI